MSIIPKVLELKYWPDPILARKASPIQSGDMEPDELEQLIADMIRTMDENQGIGLAAPQVGVGKQLFIIRIEPSNTFVFINPKITVLNDKPFKWEEGCLSVPGYFTKKSRPDHIKVDYIDVNGDEQSVEFVGLYAFAVQHEYDHLEGKLFIDGASRLKQSRIKCKMKKYLQP